MSSKRLVATAVVSSAALLLSACGSGGPGGGDGEFTDGKVTLAVLNDQSGVYKDLSGPNSVKAVEMAVADFQEKYGDDAVVEEVEVVSADHQNKPDIANTKAQELYDREGADIILDVPTSSAALAVATQAAEQQKLYINIGAGTTELTNGQCNKYTFHWAYDTYQLAQTTGTAIAEAGGTDWQIIYPDYAFGQDMDKSFTAAVEGAGGTVGDHIATPFPNDNFTTFLTKAASAEPDVIGAMQAGGDLINLVKQYNEGGYADDGIDLAVGLMFITDIHSLGVEAFEGVQFAEAWYWNLDEENRAWADRFLDETGTRPSFAHAANYSAALQYLEAVQAEGTDDADTVVGHLEGKEIDDVFLKNGKVRAEDHRVIHDVYLAKVKSPDAVEEEWDYEEIVSTIPAEDAFMPLEDSSCSMG
ncbi:ABC transporter substrate-binding protein [Ornithinimicrobium pekingense]|uniref:ABC transporter permease n=1 Tax=Ornithinimicrobium pekingense TaxID=384677 RepID=A0ABQ2FAM6_9MICO|nr:ABC transporter substrate-binding protein [Ornithinimicrobium pekingense]GGK70192.1 ABC transporter permease [Ornithinimicrobium pekingense]